MDFPDLKEPFYLLFFCYHLIKKMFFLSQCNHVQVPQLVVMVSAFE